MGAASPRRLEVAKLVEAEATEAEATGAEERDSRSFKTDFLVSDSISLFIFVKIKG